MRNRSVFLLTVCSLVWAMAATTAGTLSAQTLYGAANSLDGGFGPSSLYTIDPTDGTATLIGPIGFDNVTGMAFLGDGRLVGTFRAEGLVEEDAEEPGISFVQAGLIEIDPETGAGTFIGLVGDNTTTCGRMPDITYDATTNTLYGYGDFCAGGLEGLFTIDPSTGVGTSVGPSGFTGGGNGMAIDPGDGTIYHTPFDNGSLVTLNPMTGAGTEIPGSAGNVPFRVNSLAFDASGTLFGSFNGGGGGGSVGGDDAGPSGHFLVTIDTTDGTTTTVGISATGLDGLVFAPTGGGGINVLEVPTAGQTGLVLFGLLIAGSALVLLRRNLV